MKKNYIAPTTTVITVSSQAFMAGSGGPKKTSANWGNPAGANYNEGYEKDPVECTDDYGELDSRAKGYTAWNTWDE